MHTPTCDDLGCVAGNIGVAKLGIGRDRRCGMARQFDLGNDCDVTSRCIRDELFDLFLGVKSSVALAVVAIAIAVWRSRIAKGADFGELRVFFDFDAPALIFRQMPMKHIELVKGHLVDDFFEIIDAEKMSTAIEMHAAPCIRRLVLKLHARHLHTLD